MRLSPRIAPVPIFVHSQNRRKTTKKQRSQKSNNQHTEPKTDSPKHLIKDTAKAVIDLSKVAEAGAPQSDPELINIAIAKGREACQQVSDAVLLRAAANKHDVTVMEWIISSQPDWHRALSLLKQTQSSTFRHMLTLHSLPMMPSWESSIHYFDGLLAVEPRNTPKSMYSCIKSFLNVAGMVGANAHWTIALAIATKVAHGAAAADGLSYQHFLYHLPAEISRRAYSALYGNSMKGAPWEIALQGFGHLQEAMSLEIHHAPLLLQNLQSHKKTDQILNLSEALLSAMAAVSTAEGKRIADKSRGFIKKACETDLQSRIGVLHHSTSWQDYVEAFNGSRQMHHRSLIHGIDVCFRHTWRRSRLSDMDFYAWLIVKVENSGYVLSSPTLAHIIADCKEKQLLKLASRYAKQVLKLRGKQRSACPEILSEATQVISEAYANVAADRAALCASLKPLKQSRWQKAMALFLSYDSATSLSHDVLQVLIPKIALRPLALESVFHALQESKAFTHDPTMTKNLIARIAQQSLKHKNTPLLKLLNVHFPEYFQIDRFFDQAMRAYAGLQRHEQLEAVYSLWGARQCRDFVMCRADGLSDELEVALGVTDWESVLRLFERYVEDFTTHVDGSFQGSPKQRNERLVQDLDENVPKEQRAACIELLFGAKKCSALVQLLRWGIAPLSVQFFNHLLELLDTAKPGDIKFADVLLVLQRFFDFTAENSIEGVRCAQFMLKAYELFASQSPSKLSDDEVNDSVHLFTWMHALRRRASSPALKLRGFLSLELDILTFLVKRTHSMNTQSFYNIAEILTRLGDFSLLTFFLQSLEGLSGESIKELAALLPDLVHWLQKLIAHHPNGALYVPIDVCISIQSLLNRMEQGQAIQKANTLLFDMQITSIEGSINSTRAIYKLLGSCRRRRNWQTALCVHACMQKSLDVRYLGKIPPTVKRMLVLALYPRVACMQKLSYYADPISLCVLLRAMQENKQALPASDVDAFLFSKASTHTYGASDVRFVWQTLYATHQHRAAEKLYYHVRLLRNDVHRSLVQAILKDFQLGKVGDMMAKGILMLCYLAFDTVSLGLDAKALRIPARLVPIVDHFAKKLDPMTHRDICNRTKDETDFLQQCLSKLIYAPSFDAHCLIAFNAFGVAPKHDQLQKMCEEVNHREGRNESGLDQLKLLVDCYHTNYQLVPGVSSHPIGLSEQGAHSAANASLAIEKLFTRIDWVSALKAMAIPNSSEGACAKGILQKFIFSSNLEKAVECTLSANQLSVAVTLLKVAYSQTPDSPFLHVPLLRILQHYKHLHAQSKIPPADAHRMLTYVLHRYLAQGAAISSPSSLRPFAKQLPNPFVYASFLECYFLLWSDAQLPAVFIKTAGNSCAFPHGFLPQATVERCLSLIARLPAPMALYGFTSSIAPLLPIARTELLLKLALRDVSECKSWQGALYRLQLSWDREHFDTAYEKAALRTVILHAHRRDFTDVLPWKVLQHLVQKHHIGAKEVHSLENHSFYAAAHRASKSTPATNQPM